MLVKCLFCGSSVQLIFVHGHYQCPVCKTNALPCCDGDSCNKSFIIENIQPNDQDGVDESKFLKTGLSSKKQHYN
jgi:hypothetical protein